MFTFFKIENVKIWYMFMYVYKHAISKWNLMILGPFVTWINNIDLNFSEKW